VRAVTLAWLFSGQRSDEIAWQAVRPAQPKFTDRRTGELVDLLFAFRARKVSASYINNTVIPVLCRKAGVPAADVRGNITSHRARSTIASQLYNAKEPMTLFELQAWLGHRSPQSTQFYAKISPATLTRAYDDAGYFSRNVRTAWPAPSATSTPRKTPARRSSWRPGRTCRRCGR
jgi:integrase